MILAEKIIKLRKQNGWSQEDLAARLNVSRQSVSKWESMTSIPDLDKIVKLSQIFGVSTDYLLRDDVQEETSFAMDGSLAKEEEAPARPVSMEEATAYMELVEKSSFWIAAGVAMCILSPAALIILGGMQENHMLDMTKDAAAGIGIIVSVLYQVLARSGREDQAMMTALIGLVAVMMIVVSQIGTLFDSVKNIFGL